LNWQVVSFTVAQQSQFIKLTVTTKGTGLLGFYVNHTAEYIVNAQGNIRVNNQVEFSDTAVVLARLGVRLFFDTSLRNVTYFGRGPQENYADRKTAADIGIYSSTIKAQLTPYEKPMEAGNHEDIEWVKLQSNTGAQIRFSAAGAALQMSALPYSDEELEKPAYRIDLPPSTKSVLCISAKTLGVGSNACGPKPMPGSTVLSKASGFSYEMRLLP
jgi:beta-galactosidase